MRYLRLKSKTLVLAAVVMPACLLAACGGSSHPKSTSTPARTGLRPLTTSTFRTVLPAGWTYSVLGESLCGKSALLCLFTKQGSAYGAAAIIAFHSESPQVPDSQLASSLMAGAKRIGGQNIQLRSATVAGEHAAIADFTTQGGGYAAANWESTRFNHGGKTYVVDLQAAQMLAGKSATKLWTDAFLPALHETLTAWNWR